ncbi:MAG: hypothetical protein JW966_00555 [Anaerolineae bacterium]|nr:hypothetical protein [Anaerolineae bacterium]
MHKRTYLVLILLLALVLLLAACGGGDDEKSDSDEAPDGDTAVDGGPPPEATEELGESIDFTAAEPGLDLQSGLTEVLSAYGEQDGTAYFFAEIRNDTGLNLHEITSIVKALDDVFYPLTTVDANPLLVDVPPGQTFTLGVTYAAPEGYTDQSIWVVYTTEEPTFEGYFDLPVTIDASGPQGERGYTVRGTVQNPTDIDLVFPVVDVMLIGPDDNLVGYVHAVVADKMWPVGGSGTFEANVPFVAGSPERVVDVRVYATGYAMPQ